LNCLVEVVSGTLTAEYQYNGDNDRVRQVVGGATTDYTLDVLGLSDVLVEHSGGNATAYFYGLGLLGAQLPGGARQFYGLDGLGSVRLVSDASRALLALHDYDPFGVPRSGISTPFGFTGQQWDSGAGLLYLRARYYDPQLGRFLSRDPFPGLAAIPQSLHPYAYAFNNPVNLVDPSGEFAPLLVPIIGALSGGGFAAWQYMQAHPCANFLHDPAFQRAVLIGAGAGAIGFTAGFLVAAFAPAGGLGTAIIVGAISGGIGGGVEEFARQALSGESINSQAIGAAMLGGVVSGGVLGGVGYGVGRAWSEWRGGNSLANNPTQAPPEVVYKAGSRTATNLTPRPGIDTTGLSTFDTPEGAFEHSLSSNKAQVIEVSRLKPPLRAAPDPEPPGHVSITPGDPALIEEWAATRGTDTVHPFTQNIKEAITHEVRRPK
jgi:RHS repeat-associated protein